MKLAKKIGILVLIVIIMSIPVFSFAGDATDSGFWDDMFGDGEDEISTTVTKAGGTVLTVIRTAGYIVAIGMLIWIGIKWITSTAQERADLKGKAVNYVIGAVFIFGASFILPKIVTFIQTTLGE